MIDHNDYSFQNMINLTALLGTTVQQFVREKLTLIFYLAAWKMITAADSKVDFKKNPVLVLLLTSPA